MKIKAKTLVVTQELTVYRACHNFQYLILVDDQLVRGEKLFNGLTGTWTLVIHTPGTVKVTVVILRASQRWTSGVKNLQPSLLTSSMLFATLRVPRCYREETHTSSLCLDCWIESNLTPSVLHRAINTSGYLTL